MSISRLQRGLTLIELIVFIVIVSVALAGVLCCAWLIAQIVARRAPDRALQSVVFLAWNPLALFEATTNGHNDVIMLAGVKMGFFTS